MHHSDFSEPALRELTTLGTHTPRSLQHTESSVAGARTWFVGISDIPSDGNRSYSGTATTTPSLRHWHESQRSHNGRKARHHCPANPLPHLPPHPLCSGHTGLQAVPPDRPDASLGLLLCYFLCPEHSFPRYPQQLLLFFYLSPCFKVLFSIRPTLSITLKMSAIPSTTCLSPYTTLFFPGYFWP